MMKAKKSMPRPQKEKAQGIQGKMSELAKINQQLKREIREYRRNAQQFDEMF